MVYMNICALLLPVTWLSFSEGHIRIELILWLICTVKLRNRLSYRHVLTHCGQVTQYDVIEHGQLNIGSGKGLLLDGTTKPLPKPILTHWGQDKMAAVSQTTLSNAFSWMKMLEFRLRFISLKFVPKGPINNNPALVQIMAWRRSGDKPLSEPMMVSLLTHICVTRPQWVNSSSMRSCGIYQGQFHRKCTVFLSFIWAWKSLA